MLQTPKKSNLFFPDHSTNIRFLTTPERRETISKLRHENSALARQIGLLQLKIEKATLANSIAVDKQMSSDMVSIMDESHGDIINILMAVFEEFFGSSITTLLKKVTENR